MRMECEFVSVLSLSKLQQIFLHIFHLTYLLPQKNVSNLLVNITKLRALHSADTDNWPKNIQIYIYF